MNELKPCPICGGNPKKRCVGDNKQYIVYFCEICGNTPVGFANARRTNLFARIEWNKAVRRWIEVDIGGKS